MAPSPLPDICEGTREDAGAAHTAPGEVFGAVAKESGPPSLIGVLVWIAASFGFRAYLHFFNSYSKTYGSLGAVMILLMWLYVTSFAFLVGGEINAQIEHAAARRGHPEAKAPGEKKAA